MPRFNLQPVPELQLRNALFLDTVDKDWMHSGISQSVTKGGVDWGEGGGVE